MADRKLYDYDGNVIPTEPVKKLYDYEGKPFESPLPSDNTIGRHIVEAIPYGAGVAGTYLGGPGLGTSAGIGLGTMVKQALQKQFPDKLGEAPSGVADIAADTGKELLLNQTAPWALGKLGGLLTQIGMNGPKAAAAINLRMLPAVREGVSQRMADSIGEQFGQSYKRLGDFQPLKFAEETVPYQPIEFGPGTLPSPGYQARTPRGTFGRKVVEQEKRFSTTNASGPEQQVPSGIVGRTLGAFKPGEDNLTPLITAPHIDAEKTLAELTGANASRYADSMPPETYASVKDMLGTMKEMQKKKVIDKIINYKEGRLVWGAGMGTLAAFGHPVAATVGESPVILNYMMDRIMSNKETAQLVTAALRTPAKAPQADLINKALTVALPRLFLEGAGVDTTGGQSPK